MAEIQYTHTAASRGCVGKYPFDEMKMVGDFFDAPAVAGGLRNAAYYHSTMTGRRMRTFRISTGMIRVMLVETDGGAS